MSIFGKDAGRDKINQHFEHDETVQGDELAPYAESYEINRDELHDENYKAYKHVSELSFGIDRIPEKLLKRAFKVFSKHTSKEVREWASHLIKSYQMLHAVEKPMNLDYVKPFANTSDLKNMTPTIHEEIAKAKEAERQFRMSPIQQMKRAAKGEDKLEPDSETPTQTIVLEHEVLEGKDDATGGEAKAGAASVKTSKSKSEQFEEKQAQEFKLSYKREHAIGYL